MWLLQLRIPLLDRFQSPLRSLIRVAKSAAIWNRLVNRNRRRNEVEGMVSGFGPDGIFSGLWHVAIDALAAGAGRRVMRVVRNGLIRRADEFARAVTGQTQSICFRRFDRHRTMPRAVRVVAV